MAIILAVGPFDSRSFAGGGDVPPQAPKGGDVLMPDLLSRAKSRSLTRVRKEPPSPSNWGQRLLQ